MGVRCGYRYHKVRAIINLAAGAKRKGVRLARVGVLTSLAKSFSASANGWGSPISPTLLGPFRV